jgi:hypothetical protein
VGARIDPILGDPVTTAWAQAQRAILPEDFERVNTLGHGSIGPFNEICRISSGRYHVMTEVVERVSAVATARGHRCPQAERSSIHLGQKASHSRQE